MKLTLRGVKMILHLRRKLHALSAFNESEAQEKDYVVDAKTLETIHFENEIEETRK